MKASTIKLIVVKLNNKASFEFEVEGDVFQDVYVEAATRAIEKIKNDLTAVVRPIIECWEKKDETRPEAHIVCNSYWALVNAGLYSKAEILREKFKAQYDKDLKGEPIRGSSRKSK